MRARDRVKSGTNFLSVPKIGAVGVGQEKVAEEKEIQDVLYLRRVILPLNVFPSMVAT